MQSIKICSIDGCEKKHKARGWCNMHYTRWRRHGRVDYALLNFDPEDSFHAYTEWDGDCLLWVGYRNDSGYGVMTIKQRPVRAHRYAWERKNGPIAAGLEINHKCWRTDCVNVHHLETATSGQNKAYLSGPKRNSITGVRNVRQRGSKFYVRVTKSGVTHYFGAYDSIEEAAEVAERARKELFGEFAGNG